MPTVMTVLRSGGEFKPLHVQAMQRQVQKWAPAGTRFLCLSDMSIEGVETIPLRYDWPGWWSKLELFRPDLDLGDFLYTDLDNTIGGDITDILRTGEMLGEYVCQRGGWTALMWLPEKVRASVWKSFMFNPEAAMQRFDKANVPEVNALGNYGDAGAISEFINVPAGAERHWEDLLPGMVVNVAHLIGKHKQPPPEYVDTLRNQCEASVRYLRRIASLPTHQAMYKRTFRQLLLLGDQLVDAGEDFTMPGGLPEPEGHKREWPSLVPRDTRVVLFGQPRRPWRSAWYAHLYKPASS